MLLYLYSYFLITHTVYHFFHCRRKDKGPINFQAMVPQTILTNELVFAICKEYRIMSCDIFARCDATVDQLIDVIEVCCVVLCMIPYSYELIK